MTRHLPRVGDDEGASLIIALAFVTIVAIGATALLTLADTGLRTAQSVRAQGYELYSASGAVDQAITTVRQNTALGHHAGPCLPVGTTTTINGVPTEVLCSGALGSGGGGGGGGASYDNMPRNAVLTLAKNEDGEDGLVQESNNVLRITGPVVSNSTVKVNVSSASLNVVGPVSARGACSPTVVSLPLPDCDKGAAAMLNSTDPGYAMQTPSGPVPPALAAAPEGCPSSGGPRFVQFSPGKYDSAAALNDVFTRCSGGVFHFTPGFYYFDFPSSSPVWNILGSSTRVVGGVPARWSNLTPTPGDTGVTVPFSDDTNPLPSGGCVSSQEAPTTPGVQFAFGGLSRLYIKDAKVELCARGSSTQQQIAVYGIPPARDTTVPPPPAPTPTPASYVPTGPVGTSGDPLYQTPDSALTADGLTAAVTATVDGPGSTSRLTVPALTGPPIPVDATVNHVRLRLMHRSENSNITGLTARLSSGGTALAQIGHTGGGCSGTTTNSICRNPSPTLYNQLIDFPGTFTPATLNGGLQLSLDTDLKAPKNQAAGVHHLDYIALEVVYTPAPTQPTDGYKKLTGCLETPLSAGGCPLIETIGGPTELAVHGTVYAPTAALKLELTNVGSQVLRRGVIARTTHVKVTGSSAFLGSPISLPPLTGAPGNREVVFTAKQGGTEVLRAVVIFDDTATISPDRRADIKSWTVLR